MIANLNRPLLILLILFTSACSRQSGNSVSAAGTFALDASIKSMLDSGRWAELEAKIQSEAEVMKPQLPAIENYLFGANPCPGDLFVQWMPDTGGREFSYQTASGEVRSVKASLLPVRVHLANTLIASKDSTSLRIEGFLNLTEKFRALQKDSGDKCLAWMDGFMVVAPSIEMANNAELVTKGKDLILVARKFSAANSSLISLDASESSGANAEVDAKDTDARGNGKNGKDGSSGLRGGNLWLVSDHTLGFPLISTRGSNGSRGGNGSNGIDAVPGKVGDTNMAGCQLTRQFRNPSGYLLHTYEHCNDGKRHVVVWKGPLSAPDKAGGDAIPGGRGGDAGRGGHGGAGGNVNVVLTKETPSSNVEATNINTSGGLKGVNGIPGRGGKGAKGGQGLDWLWPEQTVISNSGVSNAAMRISMDEAAGSGLDGKDVPDSPDGNSISDDPSSRQAASGHVKVESTLSPQSDEWVSLQYAASAFRADSAFIEKLAKTADELFKENLEPATAQADALYKAILDLDPKQTERVAALMVGNVANVLTAKKPAAAPPSPNDLTVDSNFNASIFEALYRRTLINKKYTWFGYAQDYVPAATFESLNEILLGQVAEYQNLSNKKDSLLKEVFQARRESRHIRNDANLMKKFDLDALSNQVDTAEANIHSASLTLQRLQNQYDAKLKTLQYQTDYQRQLKQLPDVRDASGASGATFAAAGSFMANSATGAALGGLPGIAIGGIIGLGSSFTNNLDRAAYQQQQTERDRAERNLREMSADNDLSSTVAAIADTHSEMEQAAFQLSTAHNEKAAAQLRLQKAQQQIQMLDSYAASFFDGLDPEDVYDDMLERYRNRLIQTAFLMQRAFLFKWKVPDSALGKINSLNMDKPEQFREFLEDFKEKDTLLAEERGKIELNPTDISNPRFAKDYFISTISPATAPGVFDVFKKTGVMNFKLDFSETMSASPFAFRPHSDLNAEIISVDIWFKPAQSAACQTLNEARFTITPDAINRFKNRADGVEFQFNAPNLSQTDQIVARSTYALGSQGVGDYSTPTLDFVQNKLFYQYAAEARRLVYPRQSPMGDWSLRLMDSWSIDCIDEVKFVIFYRHLLPNFN